MLKSGLFWKTLGAFCATLTALGAILALYYKRPLEGRRSDHFAPSLLLMLEQRVEEHGPEAARRDVKLFAPSVRNNLVITHLPTVTPGRETAFTRRATAPDGQEYLLAFPRQQQSILQILPWRTILGSTVAGLLFSIAFALSLSRPIRSIRAGFRQLADGELDVELDEAILRRKDEFAHLAHDFNRMTQRLRALVGARDRLLHDVSHEFRSPLTRLQLATALAKQDTSQQGALIERVEREADKLEKLVDELLILARVESGAEVVQEFFDPVSAVADVIADGRLEADAKDVSIELQDLSDGGDLRPPVKGSAALFQRAFENLLRNAIRFSPHGTRVTVEIAMVGQLAQYRISVSDRGPGVDPALLGHLLEPFVKSGPEGVGLGLAIADRATRALGGSLHCRNGERDGFITEMTLAAFNA